MLKGRYKSIEVRFDDLILKCRYESVKNKADIDLTLKCRYKSVEATFDIKVSI